MAVIVFKPQCAWCVKTISSPTYSKQSVFLEESFSLLWISVQLSMNCNRCQIQYPQEHWEIPTLRPDGRVHVLRLGPWCTANNNNMMVIILYCIHHSLILLMLKPEYPGKKSIFWRLTTWLLALPVHQQPRHRVYHIICRIIGSSTSNHPPSQCWESTIYSYVS